MLLLMTDNCQITWQPTQEQVDKIILPGMQDIAQTCAGYINELQCPPEFVAIMLRDIAKAFESTTNDGDGNCSCC